MATINLGAIKFNWKGAYNSSTTYAVDDVVSSGGNSYVCIQAHSNQAVGNATAYWNIMSSAGTNGTDGTDLTTTLTTQGDLVYRDGSGLQRLGAGTSGQLLQTGGTGANPSWSTVSSDMVKLVQLDLDSNPAQVQSIDGYFSSTYTNYKIILNGVHMASGNGGTRVGWYFRRSNAPLTSNNTYILARNKIASGSQGAGELQEYSWNASSLNRITQDMDNGAVYTISGEFYVFNALETTRYPTMIGSLTSVNDNATDFYGQEFACSNSTTGALSGVELRATADTLDGGTITFIWIEIGEIIMSNENKKFIVNPENPNGILVDFTAEEITENETLQQTIVNEDSARETAKQADATNKANGNQKLLDLGLTQAEATALTGYTPPVAD